MHGLCCMASAAFDQGGHLQQLDCSFISLLVVSDSATSGSKIHMCRQGFFLSFA